MSTIEQPDLPLSFRAELLARLLPQLRAGECCSLVGTSGVGKSNLVRFLARPDVQNHYWPERAPWIVLVDSHSLVFGEWSSDYIVLELILHRLIMESERRGLPVAKISWADDLHRHLLAQPSAHLALRYVERLCAWLCDELKHQVILVFDQFEDVWQALSARFFLNLRQLRDQFKYQLVYLTVSRQPLVRTRDDLAAVEAFWELFANHIYGLGMYSEADARLMIERLEARAGVPTPADQQGVLLQLSGRHPGLLRSLFWATNRSITSDMSPVTLLTYPSVVEECAKLWNDLSAAERRVLATLVAGGSPDPALADALADLRLKELVIGDPPRPFSPVFATYVQTHSETMSTGIVVNTRLRQVWVDGQLLAEPLSPLEFDLLAYLAQHAGSVCRRDDILHAIYKEDYLEVNDQRLDTVLRRLREALSKNDHAERYLVTHRGVGIQLTLGQVLT
ncbi:MAG: winged helix-turn-helix domain-containing protein [Chloroflexota bacterium]|nr:winged helix-turn-helix domain-containing protein [Chloroflexota bacterium]